MPARCPQGCRTPRRRADAAKRRVDPFHATVVPVTAARLIETLRQAARRAPDRCPQAREGRRPLRPHTSSRDDRGWQRRHDPARRPVAVGGASRTGKAVISPDIADLARGHVSATAVGAVFTKGVCQEFHSQYDRPSQQTQRQHGDQHRRRHDGESPAQPEIVPRQQIAAGGVMFGQ